MGFVIAVDGPAGAGKSTIAKAVAKELGFIYVDTGALYRSLAFYFLSQGVAASDEKTIQSLLPAISVQILYQDGMQRVLLNEEDVTDQIRQEAVGTMASTISSYPCVREKLLGLQREIASEQDVIMDGRDIGTQVVPDAPLKIYLTASVEARAQRRYLELKQKGEEEPLEEVQAAIERRDYQDMHRSVAPLRQAEDAVYVDTSHMDIPQVLTCILNLYEQRAGKRA